MKPYAYNYNWAQALTADGPTSWVNRWDRTPPPNWAWLSGQAKDVEPLYSRAQMSEVRYQLELERCRNAELERENLDMCKEWLDTFGTYASVLRPFVALMAKELAANSHKGGREGWLGMTQAQAWSELKHHVKKLDTASSDEENKEHAADVANCCMMLLDVMGLLGKRPKAPKSPAYTPELCQVDRSNPCGWCAGCNGGDPIPF